MDFGLDPFDKRADERARRLDVRADDDIVTRRRGEDRVR